MSEKFTVNPFNRSALTDYRQLAGRVEEFRQIRFVLRSSSNDKNRIKSILINGERGVGKTSFLNLIEIECEINNLIPVRIDLTESNASNSNDFFWHLFSQTINKLFSLGFFGGKNGIIDLMIQKILNTDGISDHANWVFHTPILRKNFLNNKTQNFEFNLFIEDLKLMRKHIIETTDGKFNESTKILFLVDEIKHLYSNKEIIEELRFVLQSQDLGVGFVFAGDSNYKTSQWEDVFGGSYRDFEIISLNYFNDVESVTDYFRKSLNTIGWTENEIEETLFYRFKLACRNIFQLTSGKPAWINTIASKMFERCMMGEVKQMKFDKQAHLNVKKMLEDSGGLDKLQLEYIEHLSPQKVKWLAEIFSCQFHSFKQVYFFTKYKLSGENLLSIDEFESFCNDLINKKIITILSSAKKEEQSELTPKNTIQNILDSRFYAFDFNSDTIKQWLQISSDGIYKFRYDVPGTRFATFINDELTTEKVNNVVIEHKPTNENELFRLSKIIKKINNKDFDLSDETYEGVLIIFKACKKLENSRDKEILYIELKNLITTKSQSWNIYNYNDKEKIISFKESPSTIKRITDVIQFHNNETEIYEISITIDRIQNPELKTLQDLIISSGDLKKIGIILEDKMEDLVRYYVKESNVESSYEIANFFFQLFEEGHDLDIRYLNNAGYVFTEKGEYDKAHLLLNEARRKISVSIIASDELENALLVKYNIAIVEAMRKNYSNSIELFREAIDFFDEKDLDDNLAAVLKVIEVNDIGEIELVELKSEDKKQSKIMCKELSELNIEKIQRIIDSK